MDHERLAAVSSRAVAEATRSLSALLGAGVPLTKALETTRDIAVPDLALVLGGVLDSVRGGASLARSLSQYPDVFGPLYVGVVRAGERSGRLARITDRLAGELERQQELRERVVSASIYPAALVLLGAVSLTLLMMLVVPRFAGLLLDTGAELPATTAALLATSSFVRTYWSYLIAAAVAVMVSAASYLRSYRGQAALSRVALELPIIGSIRRGLLAARFSRVLAVLLEGGAPVVSALSEVAESVADPACAAEVQRVREDVRVGTPLHRSISEGTLFPPELARLVAVGEESGRLAEFLSRASDLFEQRSVRAIDRAVTLLEPTVIVVFGGLVALVALALLQAIYGVNAGAFGK